MVQKSFGSMFCQQQTSAAFKSRGHPTPRSQVPSMLDDRNSIIITISAAVLKTQSNIRLARLYSEHIHGHCND